MAGRRYLQKALSSWIQQPLQAMSPSWYPSTESSVRAFSAQSGVCCNNPGCEHSDPEHVQHAPNQSITYFEVFGLYEHDPGGSEQYLTNYSDAKFELDSGELDHRFKQMQKMVHPDLYGGRSEEEQNVSAEVSSFINIAYKTLTDPLSRGEYLLKIHGIDALKEDGRTDVDPAVLMEIMEIRESLMDAESVDERLQLRRTAVVKCEECIAEFSNAFSREEFESAESSLVKLQYFQKFVSDVDHLTIE